MSKGIILDTRIRLRPTKELVELIGRNADAITELPENIAKALALSGHSVSSKVEILNVELAHKQPKIDTKLLADLLSGKAEETKSEKMEAAYGKNEPEAEENAEVYLHLSDLRWLNCFLTQLRKEQKCDYFLHDFIDKCALELPKNEVIERNPVLEARCKRLREEQQNRDYRKMTKDVDATLKNYPEDTIAYQMKSMNSQIIAVLQFVLSVAAGFAFGFLGVELIIGNLEFGFRLLLGIMCALIIALAEIYFLAKKLNEYDNIEDTLNQQNAPLLNKKVHTD